MPKSALTKILLLSLKNKTKVKKPLGHQLLESKDYWRVLSFTSVCTIVTQ